MKLSQLIEKSWYGSIGYIEDKNTIDLYRSYLQYNKPLLDKFRGHIFVFTYKDLDKKYLEESIYLFYPNAIILYIDKNRGHGFGIADSETLILNYCKDNDIEWLCKTSMDIIITPEVLNIPIIESDFYYTNGVGYGGMAEYGYNLDKISHEEFFPQTNFYIINICKIDYLYNVGYINKTYNESLNIPNYNGKTWEYWEGWTCEIFLRDCVNRNKLSKYHLINEDKYYKLLKYIFDNKIVDCSYKNIMIEGICHFHFPNQPVILI